MNMNQFLFEYYRRLIMSQMADDAQTFASFTTKVDNDSLSDNQKRWAKELLQPDPANPDKLLKQGDMYVVKDLPNESEMDNAEWQKLYKELQKAFVSLSNAINKDDYGSLKNNEKLQSFVKKYFGLAKTIKPYNVSSTGNAQIGILQTILNNNNLRTDVISALQDNGLMSYINVDKLKKDIKDKKYITDEEVQNQIQYVLQALSNYQAPDPSDPNRMTSPFVAMGVNINDLDKWFSPDVNANDLSFFKSNYQNLLNDLHSQPSVAEIFFKYDHGAKIATPFQEAKKQVDYADPEKNPEDYVKPKRADELTGPQKISKFFTNNYNNYLKKYAKFSGDCNFFSPSAKRLVEAIDNAGVKPTDGLDGVLKNADKILQTIKGKDDAKSYKSAQWLFEKLKTYQADKSKKFAGALKNGTQLRSLVADIISDAVKENKPEEAKVAMEVLSVIKYGYTTSKVMDALKGEHLTLFSDSSLSWNSNQGMQFVSKIVDGSIEGILKLTGYAITAGANAIRLNNSKFNGRMQVGKNSVLKSAHDTQKANSDANKQQLIQEAHELNLATRSQRQDAARQAYSMNARITGAGGTALTDANYETEKENIRNRSANVNTRLNNLNKIAENPNSEYSIAKAQMDKYNDLQSQQTDLQGKINTATQQHTKDEDKLKILIKHQKLIRRVLKSIPTSSKLDAEKNALTLGWLQKQQKNIEEMKALRDVLTQSQNNINGLNGDLAQTTADISSITGNPDWARQQNIVAQFDSKKQALEDEQRDILDRENAMASWKDATDLVKSLQAQRDNMAQELGSFDSKQKDLVKELSAYWDMLESGRDSHTGKMYSWWGNAEKKQKQFNNARNNLIAQHLAEYNARYGNNYD